MKIFKIELRKIVMLVLILFVTGTLVSCSTKSSSNETETHDESDGDHHDEAEGDDHHEASAEGEAGETITWMPSETTFSGSLKLAQGDLQKLNPKVSANDAGDDQLNLTLNGESTTLLFDQTMGSIGADINFANTDFKGMLSIVHHYQDANNYDALVISNNLMQMVRVENGKTSSLDKKEIQLAKQNSVRLSVAGEHWKGYLNNELYNHGHAELRPEGKVGVVLEGRGNLQLGKIEVTPLTEE